MKNKACLLLIGCALFSLSACGNNSGSNDFVPSLDVNTEGTVNIRGHFENFEALDAQIDKFTKIYPNVDVNYKYVNNYAKKTEELLSGDEAPDIFFISNNWENDSNYAHIFNYTENLDDPSTGIDLSCVREKLLYKNKDGHVPFVPIFTNSYGMIVNEKIFEEQHLAIPQTYQELIDCCNALVNAGYTKPVMSYKGSLYSLYYPHFLNSILNQQESIGALNNMTSGESIRSSLELCKDFLDKDFVDKDGITADKTDNICYRFYEGDVPIIFSEVNRLSGSDKRERRWNEGQMEKPEEERKTLFKYSFHPIPSTEQGGFYYNTLTLSFAVNKNSQNLEMANEFMRFLIRTQNLNEINEAKRQFSPCKVVPGEGLFGSFKSIIERNRVIYYQDIGLTPDADTQARRTFDQVMSGAKTVDEAIADYGSN